MTKVKILHKDCDPSLSEDKSLPNTCYVVEYYIDGIKHYDLVVSTKQVDIFDYYYDEYKDAFITMYHSSGTANPKVWNSNSKKSNNKK